MKVSFGTLMTSYKHSFFKKETEAFRLGSELLSYIAFKKSLIRFLIFTLFCMLIFYVILLILN
jgi:hypothetical protein